ncbi:MAG: IS1182 family transposase [Dehalococcoidia bacterium]|nr:IS1182 family transposase [Dehalococcoidia bacterium]
MSQISLLNLPDTVTPPPPAPATPATARVYRPVRNQREWVEQDLDSLLPQDHQARAVWAMLDGMDLSAFYADIKAVLDKPGHPASDPQVLLALWVYATVEGVGSARRLDRLCHQHDAYRWLRGGVPVNYHMLSDFRVARRAALDDLLTRIVGCMLAAEAVTLGRVAQDGMRVRASAGAASFRREETLERCLTAAWEQVERVAQEREHPDPDVTKRQQAARERAAREREQRVTEALAYVPQVQAAKERQQRTLATGKREKVTAPRVSTTDPEARVMKMPDGGFRPAYNVELATVEAPGKAHGIIVGVAVTTEGTDAGQAVPMEEQVVERTGSHPQDYLVDGGFATREAITTLGQRSITVYAPVRLPRNKPEEERYLPRQGDSPEVAAWRERMATAEAKAIYKVRGALAEWANAQVRHLGVSQFTVRGVAKVTAVMLLIAVTHNLLRWLAWGT